MIDKVISGQSITTGPAKLWTVRCLLEGKTLTDFEASITTNTYMETGPKLKSALNDVAVSLSQGLYFQTERSNAQSNDEAPEYACHCILRLLYETQQLLTIVPRRHSHFKNIRQLFERTVRIWYALCMAYASSDHLVRTRG